MQRRNAVVQNKMQNSGVDEREAGGKLWWNHYHIPGQQNHPPIMDQRDGLLAWLREEFAAANAMIDALCHHLAVVGDAGEYDEVIGCIDQRRCNWSPVLYMQHFFPVSEVLEALSRPGWRRQQQGGVFERNGRVGTGRDYHRRGGERTGQRFDGSKGRREINLNNTAEMKEKSVEDKDIGVKLGADSSSIKLDSEPAGLNDKNTSVSDGLWDKVNHAHSEPKQDGKQTISVPKTFVVDEIVDGKTYNIVEEMKLYEELLDGFEVSRLTSLVNDTRAAGRRGQFNAQTFVINKRPINGHGREMIQFGVPIAYAPPEEEATESNVEPIPILLLDVIEKLLDMKIVTVEPDSCVIDIFNEGDYSQPHVFPHWFGRPICVLLLTDCDLSLGKIISADHPGHYRGSLNLSLKPGSVLTFQGRSADMTRHAIPSLLKQRIIVTLVKFDPKQITSTETNRVPPHIRSPNHFRSKQYTSGLWTPPTARSPTHQPILIPPPLVAPIPFPVALSPLALSPVANGGWTAAPPPLRYPVPGTGVFLPLSSSANSSNQSVTVVSPSGSNGVELPSLSENSNSGCSNGEVVDVSNVKTPEECFEEENENHQVKSTAEEGGHHQTSVSETVEK